MDIYVVNYIAVEGALLLYEENKPLFQERFPKFFIKQIEDLKKLCTKTELVQKRLEKNTKCVYITQIKEGGIFKALWDALETLKKGCNVFISEIPIKQEVIEITELLSENPYEIASSESLLFIAESNSFEEDFEEELKFLEEEGIVIKKIGSTNSTKDKVVIKGENKRFLTPWKRQEKDIKNRKNSEAVYERKDFKTH